MDFKAISRAVLFPAIVLIVLGLISTAVSYYSLSIYLDALESSSGIASQENLQQYQSLSFVPLILGLVSLLVVIWAGYRAGKLTGKTLGGAVGGAIATVPSTIISGIANMLLILPLTNRLTGFLTGGLVGQETISSFSIVSALIGLAIGLVIGLILGFVLGAIGGFLGKRRAVPEQIMQQPVQKEWSSPQQQQVQETESLFSESKKYVPKLERLSQNQQNELFEEAETLPESDIVTQEKEQPETGFEEERLEEELESEELQEQPKEVFQQEPPSVLLSQEEQEQVKQLVDILESEKQNYLPDEVKKVILEKGYSLEVADEVIKRLYG